MTKCCVIATYDDFDMASGAVDALEDSSFPSGQLSLVVHSESEQLKRDGVFPFGEETEQDAHQGAAVGSLLGLLVGSPMLLIPGVGSVLVAGPLAAAMVGGFLGAMSGWGVHEKYVRHYEELVKQGKVLIVATGSAKQARLAEQRLLETEAHDVHCYAPIDVDAPDNVDL